MIWIIYIISVVYCLYKLGKRHQKNDLGGGIGTSPGLDTIKPNDFKFTANNKYLLLDEKILLFNEPISVFNAQGQLIDKQTIKPQAKWYLGLYKEGLYYFECKKRYFKVSISK
jgi:hypothetical protein